MRSYTGLFSNVSNTPSCVTGYNFCLQLLLPEMAVTPFSTSLSLLTLQRLPLIYGLGEMFSRPLSPPNPNLPHQCLWFSHIVFFPHRNWSQPKIYCFTLFLSACLCFGNFFIVYPFQCSWVLYIFLVHCLIVNTQEGELYGDEE